MKLEKQAVANLVHSASRLATEVYQIPLPGTVSVVITYPSGATMSIPQLRVDEAWAALAIYDPPSGPHDLIMQASHIEEAHLVLVGKMEPTGDDGTLYTIQTKVD